MIKALYSLAIARHLLNKVNKSSAKKIIESYFSMNIISKEDLEYVLNFIEMLPENEKGSENVLSYEDHIKLLMLCAHLGENIDLVKDLNYHKSLIDLILTRNLDTILGF